MSLRDDLRQAITTAEKVGCHKTPELSQAWGVLRLEAKDEALSFALERLRLVTDFKERADAAKAWFEQRKEETRGMEMPFLTRIFSQYEVCRQRLGENWGALAPSLEQLRAELEESLDSHRQVGDALQEFGQLLARKEGDSRFGYLESRYLRLLSQHPHGYVTLDEIKSWIGKTEALEKRIAEEEAAPKYENVNEYLESQISRFEETMSVADYKQLKALTEEMDDPSSRMALWNLLREYEDKHATKFEAIKMKKLKKPRLDAKTTKDGWEILTRLAEADDPASRRAVLDELRNALNKKQGKRARDGVAKSLKMARNLAEDED